MNDAAMTLGEKIARQLAKNAEGIEARRIAPDPGMAVWVRPSDGPAGGREVLGLAIDKREDGTLVVQAFHPGGSYECTAVFHPQAEPPGTWRDIPGGY